MNQSEYHGGATVPGRLVNLKKLHLQIQCLHNFVTFVVKTGKTTFEKVLES